MKKLRKLSEKSWAVPAESNPSGLIETSLSCVPLCPSSPLICPYTSILIKPRMDEGTRIQRSVFTKSRGSGWKLAPHLLSLRLAGPHQQRRFRTWTSWGSPTVPLMLAHPDSYAEVSIWRFGPGGAMIGPQPGVAWCTGLWTCRVGPQHLALQRQQLTAGRWKQLFWMYKP